jgi:hypothetical protein
MDPLLTSLMQQASFKSNAERAVRKSCGCWLYLQLADTAKIGKETTKLQSLTKKVVHICAHSGKAVKNPANQLQTIGKAMKSEIQEGVAD